MVYVKENELAKKKKLFEIAGQEKKRGVLDE